MKHGERKETRIYLIRFIQVKTDNFEKYQIDALNPQEYEWRITGHLYTSLSPLTGVVQDAVVKTRESDAEGEVVERSSEEGAARL